MLSHHEIWAVTRAVVVLFAALAAPRVASATTLDNAIAGPSFPCPSQRDPLAQLICDTPALWRVDLMFVEAYQALRQQLSPTDQQALRQESLDFGLAVRSACGIALAQSPNAKGPLPASAPPGASACVSQAYQRQRAIWQSRLSGAAAEEASRPIEDQIAAQRVLQRLGFLSPADSSDGVFGPTTRAAITAWQTSTGRDGTGLLGNADVQLLEQEGPTSAAAIDELYRAAMEEDPQAVRGIMNGSIDARDSFGTTALKRAVAVGQHRVAAWLLAKGADPNIHDNFGASPLDTAGTLGDVAMVRSLLAANAAFWSGDGSGMLTGPDKDLFVAVVTDNIAATKSALDAGANASRRDSAGVTPLHLAAGFNDSEIAQLLLARGAEVNARTNAGNTPLMSASYDVAELLLALGADPDATNKFGFTPLHIAAFYGREATLELLLAVGANPNAKTTYKQTPLMVATNSQYIAHLGSASELQAQIGAQLRAAMLGQIPSITEQQLERSRQLRAAVDSAKKALYEARRQDLMKRFGDDADAIMGGQVRDGMSKEAVAAARGAPQTKLAILPAYEVWVYDSARISFTDGKVTHVGH